MPPQPNAEFMACMEDMVEVYCLPYDPPVPPVCMDAQCRQLMQATRRPLAAEPGHDMREDDDAARHGTAPLVRCVAPLGGWRHVEVTAPRAAGDGAPQVRDLEDGHYPDAERLRLVMDHRNTHRRAALYAAFVPAEGRRSAQCLESHQTPTHGSWLNIAESELSALTQPCLDRGSPDLAPLYQATWAWAAERNTQHQSVDWRLTTAEGRLKLKRLYPQIQS